MGTQEEPPTGSYPPDSGRWSGCGTCAFGDAPRTAVARNDHARRGRDPEVSTYGVAVRPSKATAGNGAPAGAGGSVGGLRAEILTRTTFARASGSASNTEIAQVGSPESRSCA